MRSFVGVSHISHSFTFKQQSILLPSPLGEGMGVRLFLRYSSEHGGAQQDLRKQCNDGQNGKGLVGLVELRELLYTHLRLLQFVDVLVNLLQLLVVCCTIEVTVGAGCNVFQHPPRA